MPAPAQMYDLLRHLRERPDVADVRVQILSQESLDEWPYSDTVWVITPAESEEIRAQMPEWLAPDALYDGWNDPLLPPVEAYVLPAGMKAVGLWWD